MAGGFLMLLVALFVWGPEMGQTPNSPCYIADKNMAQHRPCKPEETR